MQIVPSHDTCPPKPSISRPEKPASPIEGKHRREKCFVIMPFSGVAGVRESDWTAFFDQVLRPAVLACGYDCERSAPLRQNLIASIVQSLSTADAVIADLTGSKPNVLYELGIRHTLRGRAMVIGRRKDDLERLSDLTSYPWHLYDPTTQEGVCALNRKVAEFLKHLRTHPSMPDSPVAEFLQQRQHPSLQWLDLPCEHQQAALAEQQVQCERIISEIQAGRIPIRGGTAGYFKYFFDLVGRGSTPDRVRVFARVLAIEARAGYRRFGSEEIFRCLREAVEAGKIEIEYTVFFSSPRALYEKHGAELLERYSGFAREVRVIYQCDAPPDLETEHTIALLDSQRFALTHGWDQDGSILNPVHWVWPEDYSRLSEQYDRIRYHSTRYAVRPVVG